MSIEVGKTYIFTKSGSIVRIVESWTPNCKRLREQGPWWIVERVDTGKQMVASSQGLAPAGASEAAYLEASTTLGRNALVEVDAPEVVAAARAVCDAYTGIARTAPAGETEDA